MVIAFLPVVTAEIKRLIRTRYYTMFFIPIVLGDIISESRSGPKETMDSVKRTKHHSHHSCYSETHSLVGNRDQAIKTGGG